MNFDYTFISIMGYPVFEPMILLTNFFLFTISLYSFQVLRRFENNYARYMALFCMLLGVSSVFGAIGHAVHLQLGFVFFGAILFFMNAFSLLAIYYFFLAPLTYLKGIDKRTAKYLVLAKIWIFVIITVSLFTGNFLLIKINAGLVLLYSLFMHFRAHRTRAETGNLLVVAGVIVSFMPILIHSMELNIHKWFNYKDLSHVFMIMSLILIFAGARRNAGEMEKAEFV